MRLLLIQGGPALSDALPVLKAHGFGFDVLRQAADAARALDRAAYDLYSHLDDVCPNSIGVRISRVRRHMQHAEAIVSIGTVRGVGYMLATMEGARAAAHGGAPGRPATAS